MATSNGSRTQQLPWWANALVLLLTLAGAALVLYVFGALIRANQGPITEHRVPLDCPQEDSCRAEYRPEQDGTGAWWIVRQ